MAQRKIEYFQDVCDGCQRDITSGTKKISIREPVLMYTIKDGAPIQHRIVEQDTLFHVSCLKNALIEKLSNLRGE